MARVDLLIADFPEVRENTLAGKSDESSHLPGGAALTRGCGLMPSPQPSPTGEGANTKNGNEVAVLLLPTAQDLT
ncbi:hypothetical protein ENTCAN_08311 [Enterobacter cancerogenus ATCC 35316]|nr:hypothetical protein ENTCAN_08311 [Enterobacter cancerogenus ATCC 35316]